jgi:hypothetical protein
MKSIFFAMMILSLVFVACEKEEEDNTEEFTNKLTLGTGMSGFNITGEATTFYQVGGAVNLFWRLESVDDMAGSQVKIKIEKSVSGTFQPLDSLTFNNPQSYGHIMLSSFSHDYGTGTFRATGILVTGSKTVASKEYIVN